MVAQTFQGKEAQEIEENQRWQAYRKADDEETKYERFLLTLRRKAFFRSEVKAICRQRILEYSFTNKILLDIDTLLTCRNGKSYSESLSIKQLLLLVTTTFCYQVLLACTCFYCCYLYYCYYCYYHCYYCYHY